MPSGCSPPQRFLPTLGELNAQNLNFPSEQFQEEDLHRLQSQLDECRAALELCGGREEEARTSGREAGERCRRAEAMLAEYEADLAQVFGEGGS